MKTKTIITAIILLFSITSFAQAKEEAMAWIKEKLEQYGGADNSSYSNVQVSPCNISFIEKKTNGWEWQYSFNPSMVKSWGVGSGKTYIYADAEIIQFTYFPDGKKKYSSSYLSIRNGESGIHERMIKALTHLVTFCEKKKEAF